MGERREVQKELFEEFQKPAKSRRGPLGIGAPHKVYNIMLSNEQLILLIIGLIILLVICFSLGVEKGKRTALAKKNQVVKIVVAEDIVTLPEASEQIQVQKEAKKVIPAKSSSSLFVVQLASYKDIVKARKEQESLRSKGYEAEVAGSGKYSVLYVVGFDNKNEANVARAKLKSRYKDCFIKHRR